MGTSALQMRLELLQRLQQIAKDRADRGQPPLDLKRLPKNIRDQIEKVQQQDKALRDKIQDAQGNQKPRSPETPGQSSDPTEPENKAAPSNENRNTPPTNSRRVAPNNRESLNKALEEFNKRLERRNSQRRQGSQNTPGNRTTPRNDSNRPSQSSGEGTPSERQLSPNDGFDISKYLDRLGKNPRSSTPSGKSKQPSRNQTKPSSSGRGSSSPEKKTTPKPNLRKLWKQATEAGKSPPGVSPNRSQPRSGSQNQKPDSPTNPSGAGGGINPSDLPAPKPSDGSDAGEGIFDKALRRTLDGSVEYIGDLAKNYRKPGNKPRPRNRGGFLRDMSRKTGELFGGTRPKTAGGSGMSMPDAPSPTSLLPFIVGIGILALAWFIMRAVGNTTPQPVFVGPTPASMPSQINSRQDVIDAFHYIASESPVVKGNWWTHSRVARALRKFTPQRDDAVSELTRAYETARYLPPDETLSPQQLQTARTAIERCLP
jgi:hypothetical protein